jgi:hypothetical protein
MFATGHIDSFQASGLLFFTGLQWAVSEGDENRSTIVGARRSWQRLHPNLIDDSAAQRHPGFTVRNDQTAASVVQNQNLASNTQTQGQEASGEFAPATDLGDTSGHTDRKLG